MVGDVAARRCPERDINTGLPVAIEGFVLISSGNLAEIRWFPGLGIPWTLLVCPCRSPGQVKYTGGTGSGAWHPLTPSWVPPSTSLDASSWTRLLLCPLLLRQVQLLGKVVDTPVVLNDRIMVQTVQFLDKVIDVPVAMQRHVPMVFETVLFSDKDADVPVLCTTGAYGSRRLENVWRCRRCSSAWLGRLVTMQCLFGVDGDGAVEGFFAVFLRLFSASSSELRPRVANSCSEFVDISTLFERPRRKQQVQQQHILAQVATFVRIPSYSS